MSADVIDLRTTSPLDEETILDSVEVTGRLIVVDETPPRCGLAGDICALVAEKAFSSLKAPPLAVTWATDKGGTAVRRYGGSQRGGARFKEA